MLDTKKLGELAAQLDAARGALTKAKGRLDQVDLKAGQVGLACSVAGFEINLTFAGPETSYYPRYFQHRKALVALLRKEVYDHWLTCAGRVEGLEFAIRELAKQEARQS